MLFFFPFVLQLIMKNTLKEKFSFMPHMSRDNLGKFLPNTPIPSNNQPSLFFDDCQLPSLTAREL